MTPEQRIIAKWTFVLLFLVGVFFSGFTVRGYMAEKEALEKQNDELVDVVKMAADYQTKIEQRDANYLSLQNKLSQQEKEHALALQEALQQNDALRDNLDVARSMRLKGTSCPKGSTGEEATAASGSNDGTEVELSAETRYAVFDLRRSILQDVADLEECRAYVRGLGLYP